MPEKVDSQELSPVGGDTKPMASEDLAGQFQDRFLFMQRYVSWSPQKLVPACVFAFVVASFFLCGFATFCSDRIGDGEWWAVILIVLFLLGAAVPLVVLAMLQQSTNTLRYKVPLVPLVPALSVLVNALLIVNLKAATWLRLLVWVGIGLSMYFSYGVGHSKLDATSPKSNLLKAGGTPLPTWGSVDHEPPSYNATNKSGGFHMPPRHPVSGSVSQEALVDNAH